MRQEFLIINLIIVINYITKRMKNQQSSPINVKLTQKSQNSTSKYKILSEYDSFIQNLKKSIQNFKCKEAHNSLLICCNSKCQNNAGICGQKNCKCKFQHKKCFQYLQIQSIIENAQIKIDSQKAMSVQVQKSFDRLIDSISLARDRIIDKIKLSFFDQNQIEFLRYINDFQNNLSNQVQQKKKKISGNKFSQIYKSLILLQDEKTLLQLKNKTIKKLNNSCKQINQIIVDFQDNLNNKILYKQLYNYAEKCLLFQSQIWDSKILTKAEQILTLQQFMHQPFIKLKLLYRASQHNFSTKKFYQLCSNIPNTLVVIHTNYKKIIGGFTPIKWIKYNNSAQQSDPGLRTFLFSLTNKDKLKLINNQHATYYYNSQKWGPQFGKSGCGDLSIVNRANIENDSFVFQRMDFKHFNYGQNKQSYESFTGSNDHHFMTLQWEVFEVTFKGEVKNIKLDSISKQTQQIQ